MHVNRLLSGLNYPFQAIDISRYNSFGNSGSSHKSHADQVESRDEGENCANSLGSLSLFMCSLLRFQLPLPISQVPLAISEFSIRALKVPFQPLQRIGLSLQLFC